MKKPGTSERYFSTIAQNLSRIGTQSPGTPKNGTSMLPPLPEECSSGIQLFSFPSVAANSQVLIPRLKNAAVANRTALTLGLYIKKWLSSSCSCISIFNSVSQLLLLKQCAWDDGPTEQDEEETLKHSKTYRLLEGIIQIPSGLLSRLGYLFLQLMLQSSLTQAI